MNRRFPLSFLRSQTVDLLGVPITLDLARAIEPRRYGRLWLSFIPLSVIVFMACVGEEPAGLRDPSAVDSGACSGLDCKDGETSALIDASCDGGLANDLRGCPCTRAGAANPCFQGIPGPKSACNTEGTQLCEAESDGTLRWSACTGGAMPMPSDTCHNEVDDDCNGKVDEGCTCSGDVDLCRSAGADAGTFAPSAYTTFTIPPNPKAGELFDLFIVTKTQSLVSPGITRTGGGKPDACYGGGLGKHCASPGAGCADWRVGFFQGLKESAGAYQFEFHDPQGNGGCDGAIIAKATVTVSN